MKSRIYTVNGKTYKVRYAKAGSKVCDRCALRESLYCCVPKCDDLVIRDRKGLDKRYGYFVQVKTRRYRADLVVALVAFALVTLLCFLYFC